MYLSTLSANAPHYKSGKLERAGLSHGYSPAIGSLARQARGRQSVALRSEQHPQRILQLPHPARQRCLGTAGDSAGPAKTAMAGYSVEVGQCFQVHMCSIYETRCIDFTAFVPLVKQSD